MIESQPFWERLFPPPTNSTKAARIQMRLLTRSGKPLLLLPKDPKAAAATFDLYPAQTVKARLFRRVMQGMARLGWSAASEPVELLLNREDDFLKFLGSTVPSGRDAPPAFGILAGNPASSGQRFMILVFDEDQNPIAVVKAGISSEARQLVQREISFLKAAPRNLAATPRLRADFASDRLDALAMDFYPGNSPSANDVSNVANILSAWLDPKIALPLKDMSQWQALERAVPPEQWRAAGREKIRDHVVHPCLSHGDFAPWNIKVSRHGNWTVLDWERAELSGIPGWDWFHYYLQSAILVEKLTGAGLMQRVEEMLRTREFVAYATQSDIKSIERPLIGAYLLHMVYVVRPSEGREAADHLVRTIKFT